jgi:hypothetical protein
VIQLVSWFRLSSAVADLAVVSNLTTQRNAIQMLHERITVLLQYVIGVVNSMSSLSSEVVVERS